MHVPINVKSPNNISEWQMGFNSAFKGLIRQRLVKGHLHKIYEDLHAYPKKYFTFQ